MLQYTAFLFIQCVYRMWCLVFGMGKAKHLKYHFQKYKSKEADKVDESVTSLHRGLINMDFHVSFWSLNQPLD